MKNANAFLKELENGALNGRMVEIYGCSPEKAQASTWTRSLPLPSTEQI